MYQSGGKTKPFLSYFCIIQPFQILIGTEQKYLCLDISNVVNCKVA